MRRASLYAVCSSLLLFFGGCAPRLPLEKPVRVFDAKRELVVRLTSEPSGAEVFAVDARGSGLAALGKTPLELMRFTLRKQLWKHSEGKPPPPHSDGVAQLDCVRSIPFCIRTRTPSATTMALSTIMPIAITSAPKDIR